MKTYEITLKHDGGKVTMRVQANYIHNAFEAVCNAEKAPLSAIQHWRVVPTKKQIRRTQNLLRGI